MAEEQAHTDDLELTETDSEAVSGGAARDGAHQHGRRSGIKHDATDHDPSENEAIEEFKNRR